MSKSAAALLVLAVLWLAPAAAHAAAPYPYATFTAASVGPAPACVDPEPVPMRSGHWAYSSPWCEHATSLTVAEVTGGTVMSFISYGSSGSLYFQADPGFTGEGTVKLVATNAEGSDDLILRFAISPTYNRPPVCEDPSFDLRLGARKTAVLKCSDLDYDPITFTRGTDPVHGAAGVPYNGGTSGSDGTVVYRAPATTQESLPLADDFTVIAADGFGGTDTVTVRPTVHPTSFNRPPAGCYASGGLWGNVAYSGQPRRFYVYCSDPDGDPLTFSVTTPPSSPGSTLVRETPAFEGAANGADFTYTPAAGFTGGESFTITATDGSASVAIPSTWEVKEPPAPTCQTPQVERVRPGRGRKIGGACMVPGADGFPQHTASFEIVDPPDHGKLTDGDVGRVAPEPGAGSWTYTPDADDGTGDTSFTDSFTYVATANGKSAAPVTQQIEVDPLANQRPYCYGPDSGAHRVRASQTRRLRITCFDADGDDLTITTGDPAHGAMVNPVRTGDVLEITYDPDAGYLGQDTVTWLADDGYPAPPVSPGSGSSPGGGPAGQVVYTVVADETNTKPFCHPSSPSPGPRAGGRFTVTFHCSDPESDPLTVTASKPVNGTIVETTTSRFGEWTTVGVVFEAGAEGDAAFSAQAHDGREAGNAVTFGFPVRAADANFAPYCMMWPPFAIAVDAAKPFVMPRFGSSCGDADQDPLEMKIHKLPSHGTFVEDEKGWVYTPEPGYSGPDELALSVTDGRSAPLIKTLLMKVYATDEVHTTLTAGPQGDTKARTATFQFTSPLRPDATFECRLDSGGWESCAPGKSYSDLAEGEHEFQVRAVQGAEKDATPATRRWKVDLTGPAAPVLGGEPPALTTSSSATFTFPGSPDAASFECKLDGGEFAPCTSPKQLTGLADGEHTFSVRGVDAVGNAGAADSHTWTVDTVAPDTLLVSGPSGETDATTAAFSFTGGGSAFECRLDGAEFAPCTSPATFTGLSAAAHTFSVRAVDAAGNADATPATRSWTVVATPPATETVEGAVPPAGGTVATGAPGEAPSAATPVLLAVTVPATAAGGPVSIQTAPAPTETAPAGFGFLGQQITIEAPAATAEQPLRLTFDVDAATLAAHGLTIDTLQVFRDGAAIGPCTGPAGHAVPEVCVTERAPLAGGDVRLVVLSTHASAWNLGKDTLAPDTTITGGPTGSVAATDAAFGLQSEAGATFECSLDGAAFAPCTAPAYTGLAAGEHTFRARARDATGNVDATPASRTWTIATPPPPAPQGPGVTAPPKDTTPPALSVSAPRQKIRAAIAKGLRLTAGCSEVCGIAVTVTVDARSAKKLGLGRRAVKAGSGSVTTRGDLTIRLSGKVAAKLRKARRAVLTVTARAMDPAGNAAARTIKVTLS